MDETTKGYDLQKNGETCVQMRERTWMCIRVRVTYKYIYKYINIKINNNNNKYNIRVIMLK